MFLLVTGNGVVLKAQREAAGLTLSELAERAGCDESYLWRIEVGERKGSRYFLAHLAQVLAEVSAA